MKTDGYKTREHHQPVKRYCQFMEITDDDEKIQLYRDCHSRENSWPEIRKGIREVGILEMEMYIVKNKVVMIVETPLDFEWETAMAKLAGLPRQAEWEAFVSVLQGCDPNATSAQKWTLMDRMFYLYDVTDDKIPEIKPEVNGAELEIKT